MDAQLYYLYGLALVPDLSTQPSGGGWLSLKRAATRGRRRSLPPLAMNVEPFLPAFAAAAVLMTGAVAHADAQDDQFLGLLSRDGITAGPPEQLIALAHERCDDDSLSRSQAWTFHFGAMPSPFSTAMLQMAAKLEGQGLTGPQVRPFLLDAISVYCPGAHS